MKNRFSKNLMLNALDGTLSDQGRKAWDTLIKSNPDLRNGYAVQTEITHLLEEVAPDNPPDSLTHDIMRAVQISKRERLTWRKRIRMIHIPSVRIKYAYSFAAGLAFGLLTLIALPKYAALMQPLETSQLSGTLQPFSSVSKREIIVLEQIQGEIAWNGKSDAVDIQLSLNPQAVSTIQFEYPKGFFLKYFYNEQAALFNEIKVTPEMTDFQINTPCEIRLTLSSGEKHPAPIMFQLKQNNEIIFSQKIQ